MKNIICFLTVKPSELFYNYCETLVEPNTDVYMCIDDNNHIIKNIDYKNKGENKVKIIKKDNKICKSDGYWGTVLWFMHRACSRDKALNYFCNNNIDYKYIWFIEQDVFIPHPRSIDNLNTKYPDSDLLSTSNKIYNRKPHGWHWSNVFTQTKIKAPYGKSMICAIRCSKTLMNCIKEYADTYKKLFLDEAFFNTLAIHNNLLVETPYELSTIVFQRHWSKIKINPNHLYHPIKSVKRQIIIREWMKEHHKFEQVE